MSIFGTLLGALVGLSALCLSLLKEKLLSGWKDREQPSSMFCPGPRGSCHASSLGFLPYSLNAIASYPLSSPWGNKVTEAAAPAESQASRSHEKEGRAIPNSYPHHTDKEMGGEKLKYVFKISAQACLRWVSLGFAHMMLHSPRESGRSVPDTTTPSPEARSRVAKSSLKFPTYFF